MLGGSHSPTQITQTLEQGAARPNAVPGRLSEGVCGESTAADLAVASPGDNATGGVSDATVADGTGHDGSADASVMRTVSSMLSEHVVEQGALAHSVDPHRTSYERQRKQGYKRDNKYDGKPLEDAKSWGPRRQHLRHEIWHLTAQW